MAELSYPAVALFQNYILSSGAAAEVSGTRELGVTRHGNYYHAGNGTISGTVKEQNTPANTPLRRRVRLFREVDGLLLQETWSDATTGAYTFANVQTEYRYTIISYDYLHNYRAVVAHNIAAVA